MRETIAKRIDKVTFAVISALYVNFLTRYSISEHPMLFILLTAAILNLVIYKKYIRTFSSPARHAFYIYQLIILNFVVYYSPSQFVNILLFLHLLRFTVGTRLKANYPMVGLYMGTFLITTLVHDNHFGSDNFGWILLNLCLMYIFAFLGSAIGDYHQGYKDLARIQECLLQQSVSGIQFIDREGKNRILNSSAEAIYKMPIKKAYGQYDYDLIYGGRKFDEQGRYTSLITETLETGKEYQGIEKELVLPSGEKKVYAVQTFRVYGEYGEILGAMGIYRDVTENKILHRELENANAELARLTITDGLTELYNYRYFQYRLKVEVEQKKQSVALLMIDVDFFKQYNDIHGHQAGDRILKEIARVIKENVRSEDVVARYGGEEFAVILPGVEIEEGLEVAERLRSAVECHYFEGQEKLPYGLLTISIGIAACRTGTISAEGLLYQADTALYRGKTSGRNQVVIAS
jgi:diguanylate cyclase (GGDEF)-like protein